MRAGVSSVTHSRLLTKPAPGRTFMFGAMPSLSTMALPLSSCPVTMRRIWCPMAVLVQEVAGQSTVAPDALMAGPQRRYSVFTNSVIWAGDSGSVGSIAARSSKSA